MGRIRAVKHSGRQCRLCRRNGSFATVYCVHGKGSAFMDGIGRLFDPARVTTVNKNMAPHFESPVNASPVRAAHRSQMKRALGNLLATNVAQNDRSSDSG